MCKHVAATLYGVGARLDAEPKLLFKLRGVDENELLSGAGEDVSLKKPAGTKVLKDDDVAALFGLEMAEAAGPEASSAAEAPRGKRASTQSAGPPKKQGRRKPISRRVSAGQKKNGSARTA
jgi:uncharacterized Zn finger protein